ncbi:hypothetical protein C0W59_07630 [Photobacterium kishitanii]|uniref:AbiTii domain-containing protein n=1 Tax=Photobacterium kishitanii TaxID=318456 RepID=UPI000D16845F|nr:hypothetical protein [Photobacterium kishitanii]PSV16549.1 hypothetical protein C0W59_07630 [Photobacterium kishitanii]
MNRIEEARKVSESLLSDLEGSINTIDAILMKAKRLARIMRDTDAQIWLDFETKGYPDGFRLRELGTCQKYVVSSGRYNVKEGTFMKRSLPKIEAILESEIAQLDSLRTSQVDGHKVTNYIEKKATESLINTQIRVKTKQKENYSSAKAVYSAQKSAIHSYATDAYLSIELGDAAQNIFEDSRNVVDAFVRSHCPRAAEKLVAINERMSDGTNESRSAALTSCRRVLMDIADSVFPAQDENWVDRSSKNRKVGIDQYKNRLLAYLSNLESSTSSYKLLDAELGHLASKLDVIYEKTCKGVHIDVTPEEARLTVIYTYLFIGEIANYTLMCGSGKK